MREFGAFEIVFNAIIAWSPRSGGKNADGGIVLVAAIIIIVERLNDFGGVVFIEQELMKVDGSETGVLELRECRFGITEIIVQGGRIKELNVIIIG